MSQMKKKFFATDYKQEAHRAIQSRLAVQAIRSLTYLVENVQTGWEYYRELEEVEAAVQQIKENDRRIGQT